MPCKTCFQVCFYTLFYTYKLCYILATLVVLGTNICYIYNYASNMTSDEFFSKNQFPHCMGLFLGYLFRMSGVLSAWKEKISLTYTYILFLVLIMLMMTKYDDIFYLYLLTASMAFFYVLLVKYQRARFRSQPVGVAGASGRNVERRRAANTSRNREATNSRSVPGARHSREADLITVDLPSEDTRRVPTAPPYEEVIHVPVSHSPVNGSGLPIDAYYLQQHSPPPSYDELYEKK